MYISGYELEMDSRGYSRKVTLDLDGVSATDCIKLQQLCHLGNPVNVDIIPKDVFRIARNSVYGLSQCRTIDTSYIRETFGINEKENKNMVPYIKKVIFNDPATIVFWADGTKTVAKAHGDDKFDKEVGLTVCIAKKAIGNKKKWDQVFKKWIK